jgi:hypothetical protein
LKDEMAINSLRGDPRGSAAAHVGNHRCGVEASS